MKPASLQKSLIFLTIFISVLTVSVLVTAQTQIKPRILIIFDTSGSMALNIAGSHTRGDGSNDTWTGSRTCCPGNGGSRIYIAKQAMTNMINSSGDIQFALGKFAQNYTSSQSNCWTIGWSDNYWDNQTAGVRDCLRYSGYTGQDWGVQAQWLAVPFSDNNSAEIVSWMDGHEYSATNLGVEDNSVFAGPFNDDKEQELRADGSTPLGEAIQAAYNYLVPLIQGDEKADCRPYSVIILSDGDWNGAANPVLWTEHLYDMGSRESGIASDFHVESWVIGLAHTAQDMDYMAQAGGCHFDPARGTGQSVCTNGACTHPPPCSSPYGYAFLADSEDSLSAILYTIVSSSILMEECNYEDDDCDCTQDDENGDGFACGPGDVLGDIGVDEGWPKYCDRHERLSGLGYTIPTDVITGFDTFYDPTRQYFCDDPGEFYCDGQDDNCDGETDEGVLLSDDPLSASMIYDGSNPDWCRQPPSGTHTPDEGICSHGFWACTGSGGFGQYGGWACQGGQGPQTELCDNLDNDCNGAIDDNVEWDTSWGSDLCGELGVVESCMGHYYCNAGEWDCSGQTIPEPDELPQCNGIDDDCDGDTDEGIYQTCGGGTVNGAPSICVEGNQYCDITETINQGIPVWLDCQGNVDPMTGELCNGLDDDCDGPVDENEDIAATGTTEPFWCGGANPNGCSGFGGGVCPDGRDEGDCVHGNLWCVSGSIECVNDTPPGSEGSTCDNHDNDCDGVTDEGISEVCGGAPLNNCGPGHDQPCPDGVEEGECRTGNKYCENGSLGACQGMVNPGSETCNGLDDDCDGVSDEPEDIIGIGVTCGGGNPNGCDPDVYSGGVCPDGADEGECQTGATECVSDGGWHIECASTGLPVQNPVPEGDTCDGLDNDCDGITDEWITTVCGTGPFFKDDVGHEDSICQRGVQFCGEVECIGEIEPLTYELCNGLDDDCDGQVDEASDLTDTGANCGLGICAGQTICVNGVLECNGADPDPLETCDNLDNDCDGTTDEGVSRACGGANPMGCGTAHDEACPDGLSQGECEPGIEYCEVGDTGLWLGCNGNIDPATDEQCDGLDNDCDGEIDEETDMTGVGLDDDPTSICRDDTGLCTTGWYRCVDDGSGYKEVDCCADVVGGLCVPPVWPADEICDTFDNDCDGLVDSADPDPMPPVGDDCGGASGSNPDEGLCLHGQWICDSGGNVVCSGDTPPDVEAPYGCDNLDNDCDGATDEWLTVPCGGADTDGCDTDVYTGGVCPDGVDQGICQGGFKYCPASGDTTCYNSVEKLGSEPCNGLDDDCNGVIDNDAEGTGLVCGEGECQGLTECIDAGIECDNTTAPIDEICDPYDLNCSLCNNKDDDCDGWTDEFLFVMCGGADPDGCDPNVYPGGVCPQGNNQGECQEGMAFCDSANSGSVPTWLPCQGAVSPRQEVCDGLDNDCDGVDDEGSEIPLHGTQCMTATGVCEDGWLLCVEDDQGEKAMECCREVDTDDGTCVVPQGPYNEICDGLDNNCNGLEDEGLTKACGGADPYGCIDLGYTDDECPDLENEGECQEGAMQCDFDAGLPDASGNWTECTGANYPTVESCNLLDDDCDNQIDEDLNLGQCTYSQTSDPWEGICEPGDYICTNGNVICQGGIAPEIEICNSYDDNCNGEVDEELPNAGTACGVDLGICMPGILECVVTNPDDCSPTEGCELTCVGETGGTDEVCNLLDDDCDGQTDEAEDLDYETENPGLPSTCNNVPDGGLPTGICQEGEYVCVNGDWVCNANLPGPEICDAIDNDCDGLTDENLDVPCPAGSICIEGECAEPCIGKELSCPTGKVCEKVEDTYICIANICREGSDNALPCVNNEYWCDDGYEPPCHCEPVPQKCVDDCYNNPCPDGFVCNPRDKGRCYPLTEEDCHGIGCPPGEICNGEGECEADECADVECLEGEYIKREDCTCVLPCTDEDMENCPRGCENGECVEDLCAGVICDPGYSCENGQCIKGDCWNNTCEYFEICVDGDCVEDPCWNVECTNGYLCVNGSCYESPAEPDLTDAGTGEDGGVDTDTGEKDTGSNTEQTYDDHPPRIDKVIATGMGGCLCSSAPGAKNTQGTLGWTGLIMFILLVAAAMFSKILRKTYAKVKFHIFYLLIVLAFLVTAGCQVDPYVFGNADDNNADSDGSDSDSSATDGGLDTDSNSDSETDTRVCKLGDPDNNCDGFDDDCDGLTDEGVDTASNPYHCGGCGNVCEYPHAFGACENGKCSIGECAAYWTDENEEDTDGCEYFCMPTKSEGEDKCNGVDRGDTDDPYIGIDDDCNGLTDENVGFYTDPLNCGRCGTICRYNNAEPLCDEGKCKQGPCNDGYVDINDGDTDGCEYECSIDADAGPTEICNGIDDDCDNNIDEGATQWGAEGGGDCFTGTHGCTDDGQGSFNCFAPCDFGTLNCTAGELRCENQVKPAATESCDNIDNDCDGATDEEEDIPHIGPDGALCGSAVGVCTRGRERCALPSDTATSRQILCCIDVVAGVCVPPLMPGDQTETLCDGLDEDCDGLIDEDSTGQKMTDGNCYYGQTHGQSHSTFGECAAHPGTWTCNYGLWMCENATDPVSEICDDLDNDCDGTIDNGVIEACGGADPTGCDTDDFTGGICPDGAEQGECRAGNRLCKVGTDSGWEDCVDISPTAELCNSLDDDCDGLEDNNVTNSSDSRIGVDCTRGICTGVTICTNGAVNCNYDIEPGSQTEICNGLDDDCDDLIDENTSEACGGADPAGCDTDYYTGGVCPDGVDQGICNQGMAACVDGGLSQCNGNVNPDTDEDLCNGQDDNCNGVVDEDYVDGTACGPPCNAGHLECNNGTVLCIGAIAPSAEECNNADDNCDGSTDEGLSRSCGGGPSQSPDAGLCEVGIEVCSAGVWGSCSGNVDPEPEQCDGEDNDCDGFTDENLTLDCGGCDTDMYSGYACANGYEAGNCRRGTSTCKTDGSGTWAGCMGDIGPVDEICNGIDDDCDNIIDDGAEVLANDALVGVVCGIGVCEGLTECVDGGVECNMPHQPGDITEICDGYDNDCDGFTDEGVIENCGGADPTGCDTDSFGGGACPDGANEGVCVRGISECVDGGLTGCQGNIDPDTDPDICDGVDNDCDGLTDENYTSAGTCGPCDNGTWICQNGVVQCSGGSVPTAEECDNIDNNCDGNTDEGLIVDCGGGPPGDENTGLCQVGTSTCVAGVWQGCQGNVDPVAEICDKFDNDCNGTADDGLGIADAPVGTCNSDCPGGASNVPYCDSDSGNWKCDYWCDSDITPGPVECDGNGNPKPVEELCDGEDGNCDTFVDETFDKLFDINNCNDCNNVCATDDSLWTSGSVPAHVAEFGCYYGTCTILDCDPAGSTDTWWDDPASSWDDCDYNCTQTNGGVEICDFDSGNPIDNDCDGYFNEGQGSIEICDDADNDCNNQIDEMPMPAGACKSVGECTGIETHAVCDGPNSTWVCNYNLLGSDVELSGGDVVAEETLCDGKDNDCDGLTDEVNWTTGTLGTSCTNGQLGECLRNGVYKCNQAHDDVECCKDGQWDGDGVCTDDVDTISSANETCDALDNDCDGSTDEELGLVTAAESGNRNVKYINISDSGWDFDILSYEVSRPDADTYSLGGDNNAGNKSTAPCSNSTANKIPWTMVTKLEAEQACQNLDDLGGYTNGGWDLCSARQWQWACAFASGSGYSYPYGDTYVTDTCNGHDYSSSWDQILGSGEASQCIADWGTDDVFDMSGNAEEWTRSSITIGSLTMYQIRGGSYNDLGDGLTCDFDFWKAEDNFYMANLGFRCCRGDDPPISCSDDSDCNSGEWCNTGLCTICGDIDDDDHCGPSCTDCTGSTPICFNDVCVECDDDSDCGGSTPACVSNVCEECDDDSDCPVELPECISNYCYECEIDADCDSSFPFCTTAYECVECEIDADCDSGTPVCFNGTCYAEGDIRIFKDTFTEASNTELSAHTPDVGDSWNQLFNDDATLRVNGTADNLQGVGDWSDGAFYEAVVTGGYGSDDMWVEATLTTIPTNDGHSITLGLRVQDVDNMYALMIQNDNFTQMYKKVAGTWTTIGPQGTKLGNGTKVVFAVEGNTLSFYTEGMLILQVTDTDLPTGGTAGVGFGSVILGGNDISTQRVDNFNVFVGSYDPGYVFYDTFTEASDTELNSHTPDVGDGWTKATGSATINAIGATDQLGGTGSNTGALYVADLSGGYGSSDYKVTFRAIETDGGDDYSYLIVRYQDANNFYAWEFNNTLGTLYNVVGGTWNNVGNTGLVNEGAEDMILTLEIVGTTLTAYVNSVAEASATVTDHTLEGKAGVGLGALRDAASDANGARYDDFVIIPL